MGQNKSQYNNIEKKIYRNGKKLANELEYYIRRDIAKHMKEVYETNLTQSLLGAGSKTTDSSSDFINSDLILRSISSKIDDVTGEVWIEIADNPYPDKTGVRKNQRTTSDVIDYLSLPDSNAEESAGGGFYPYKTEPYKKTKTKDGKTITHKHNQHIIYAYNYPTPKHLFREHTEEAMKGYIANIREQVKNHTYRIRKRKGGDEV